LPKWWVYPGKTVKYNEGIFMTQFVVLSEWFKFGAAPVAVAMAILFGNAAMAHGNNGHSHDHGKSGSRHSDAAHVHGQGELEIVQDGGF